MFVKASHLKVDINITCSPFCRVLMVLSNSLALPLILMSSNFALWIFRILVIFLQVLSVKLGCLGPDNHYVSDGLFAQDYANRIGKSHVSGYGLPPGDVWRAKGEFYSTTTFYY